ncbi:hypothetical protein [Pseudarthrobacter sp. N5]|uniref:hypothetical protein n=1 Tax=Pseudarthrobacter sp. N5 TaxID=3418416 RepID=UPI003CEAE647
MTQPSNHLSISSETSARKPVPEANGLPWLWCVGVAAAGVPAGLLWWLLAPGGLNLITRDPAFGTGTNTEVWLPRDLVLAALFLFAGCLVAVILAGKGPGPTRLQLVLCSAGGLAGAVIAWRVGVLAGAWWGGPVDPSVNASVGFSLRSYGVLALWPAATAAATFVLNLLSLLKRTPDHN